MCYSAVTVSEWTETVKFNFTMSKAKLKTALVLASLLTLTGCEKEGFGEPDPITVIATVEYKTGKMVQFIYRGDLVWQSDTVKSVAYHRNDDSTFIDLVDLKSQNEHLVFQGGKLIKNQ